MGIKTMELEPTKKNILLSLTENLLDRNEEVWYFARFCDALEVSSSISINAKWGEGKTFFVKQTKMLLEAFNPFSKALDDGERTTVFNAFSRYTSSGQQSVKFKPQVCVYYDSWINDNDIDPIFSLMYEITKSTACDYPFKKGKDCLATVGVIAEFITGRNASNLAEMVRGEDFLEEIKEQHEIHSMIEEFLDSLLAENGDRLIIFIDELDRCKPTYAVQLLERIKHYFTNDRITFVFSVNINELQHTIKSCYGDGFDACRYLDRFFDYRIPLPPANMTKFYDKLGIDYQEQYIYSVCKAVINQYSFSLREINKYYRIISIFLSDALKDEKCLINAVGLELFFSYTIIVPIGIGLHMSDITLYEDFVSGNNSQPLIDIISGGKIARKAYLTLFDSPNIFSGNEVERIEIVHDEEILNKAYNALFNDRTRSTYEPEVVGKCYFSQVTKEKTLKMISMLSGYAKYDY